MRVLAAVAVGGALGSVARYGLGLLLPHRPGEFPLATLLVNVVGCLLIGVLMAVLAARDDPPAPALVRPFLGVGVLGGFTTFSTYAVDVLQLAENGAVLAFVAYAVGTVVLALAATVAGLTAVRAVLR